MVRPDKGVFLLGLISLASKWADGIGSFFAWAIFRSPAGLSNKLIKKIQLILIKQIFKYAWP